VESLAELQERRSFECRLTPDRALSSLDDAEAFLADRGMLTRTTDCALPSLYEACHEAAYQPGGRGFASWPATKWSWFGDLTERGYLILAVHRGKNLLVTSHVAALLDPICRAEISRLTAADPEARRILEHLAAAGSTSPADLATELGLPPSKVKKVRATLERCGAVVSRQLIIPTGGGHLHSSELARWDQVQPAAANSGTEPGKAMADLVMAGVRASVVAPQAELRQWFTWVWYWSDSLIEDLVTAGRLRRVDGYVTAALQVQSKLASSHCGERDRRVMRREAATRRVDGSPETC
jgi:DNA-binding Lrp family transcriptional regulator